MNDDASGVHERNHGEVAEDRAPEDLPDHTRLYGFDSRIVSDGPGDAEVKRKTLLPPREERGL